MRRLFGSTAFFLNVLAVVWIGLCMLAGYISPLKAKYLALFSLTPPFAILTNAAFALFWIFRRHKKRALLSAAALAVCFQLVTAVIGLHFGLNKLTVNDPGATRLKIMTWNVHGMGIFDRPRRTGTDDAIIDFVKKEKPDVLCMPEFYTIYSNALKPYSSTILDNCGYKEFRFQYDNTLGVRIFLGIGIFSKYPLQGFEAYVLHHDPIKQDDVLLLKTDAVLPGGKTIRFFFTHLQSYLLSDGEKTYLEEVKHHDQELSASRSRSFIRRFGEAYVKRAVQADSAASLIAQSPYPVVLCGDLNDLPGSYTYTTVKGKLGDAFVEKGSGLGRTFNMFSPTLRIDYIFYDKHALHIDGFSTIHTRLSDHNPVIATFTVKP